MISFVIALVVLIGGYFVYGTIVSRIFGQDATVKHLYIPWPTGWTMFPCPPGKSS